MKLSLQKKRTPQEISTIQRRMNTGMSYEGAWEWDESSYVYFPCNLSGTHWVLIVASLETITLTVLDSCLNLQEHYAEELGYYLDSLQVYFMHHTCLRWAGLFLRNGSQSMFPQQRNGFDCGIFLLIACRYATLGLRFDFSQAEAQFYRKRLIYY